MTVVSLNDKRKNKFAHSNTAIEFRKRKKRIYTKKYHNVLAEIKALYTVKHVN